MSFPVNPLDKYQSHSYHFILVASSSSETLRTMTTPSSDSNTPNDFLSKVNKASIGTDIGNGTFLILDSRKTAEFMIDSVNFETMFGEGNTPSETTSIYSMVNMRVTDPSGIGFFNYLKWLMSSQFKTDISGVSFLLHILFVGHTVDGNTQVEDVVAIPLTMTAEFNLTEFGSRGGVYDMGFIISSQGGPLLTGTFNKLPDNFSFKAKAGLLGNAIQSFENALNIKGGQLFQKYNPDILDTNGAVLPSATIDALRGRVVQYMITIPESWAYFAITGSTGGFKETVWKSTEVQPQNQPSNDIPAPENAIYFSPANGPDTFFSVSGSQGIEEAIKAMLNITPEIAALAGKEQKDNGKAVIPKIVTSITSDDKTILVHYDVLEYDVSNVNKKPDIAVNDKGVSPDSMPNRTMSAQDVPGGYIFDYVFSGQNIDIIDFQIKVNNLYIGLMPNVLGSQHNIDIASKQTQQKLPDSPTIPAKTPYGSLLEKQPIGQGNLAHTQDQNKNFNSFNTFANFDKNAPVFMQNVQEFNKTLADLYVTSMNNEVKIRGNPDFLKNYVIGSIPEHLTLNGKVSDFLTATNGNNDAYIKSAAWEYNDTNKQKLTPAGAIAEAHLKHRRTYIDPLKTDLQAQAAGQDQTAQTGKSAIASGTYCKINVFGPASAFTLPDASEYVQLFYDGWYMIVKVMNSFEHGSFTQVLTLLPLELYTDVNEIAAQFQNPVSR